MVTADSTHSSTVDRLAAAVVLALYAWNVAPTLATVVDDAYISARYAEHLSMGHGVTYNAVEPAVEGVTNLAFVGLLALGRMAGLPMHGLLVGLGVVFGAILLLTATGLTRALSERSGLLTWLPALWLATQPHLGVVASNGLETTMMAACVVGACWAVVAAPTSWRTAGLIAVLPLVRPEGVFIGTLLAALATIRSRQSGSSRPVWAPLLALLAATTAWRWMAFGAVLPNTFAAKSWFSPFETFHVNKMYFRQEGRYLLAMPFVGLLGLLAPKPTLERVVVWIIAGAGFLIPFRVELWMPGLRLFIPTLALLAVLLGAGLVVLPRRAGWVGAFLLTFCAAQARHVSVDRVRDYDSRHSALPMNGAERAARHLGQHLPKDSWLAIRDAGVFAYFVGPDVNVAETHHRALTQPHPHGRNADVLTYVPEHPEVLVATGRRHHAASLVYGPDKALLARTRVPYTYMGRVRQHYHRFYDVYVRGDLDVPPMPEGVILNRKGPSPPVSTE